LICKYFFFVHSAHEKRQDACSASCPETIRHQPEQLCCRLNLLLGINQIIDH
jgi:hypothetical protein